MFFNVLLLIFIAAGAVSASNDYALGNVEMYKFYGPNLGPVPIVDNREWTLDDVDTAYFNEDITVNGM